MIKRLFLLAFAIVFAAGIFPAKASAFQNFVVNGTTYPYPDVDDTDWGQDVTDWAAAVSRAVSALSVSTVPIAGVSASTTSLGVLAGNTNYLTLAGSTQTKAGGLILNGSVTLNQWLVANASATLLALTAMSSGTASIVITSTNGFIGGQTSTFTAVAASSITLRGIKYNPPPADGTPNQLLSTNGSAGLSWVSSSAGFVPLATSNLSMATFSVTSINQLQFIATMTYVDMMNQVPQSTGSLIMLKDQSLWVSTGDRASSWIYMSSPRDLDLSTGALAKWTFSYNEIGGRYTHETIFSTRTANVTGIGTGVFVATNGVVGRGINGGAAYQAGDSTGCLTIPNDAAWMSPHAGTGAIGMMAFSFWVWESSSTGAIKTYFGKRGASNYEYDFQRNSTADRTVHVDFLTNAGGAVAQWDSTGSVVNANEWNHIVIQIDKTQAVNSKGEMWINGNLMTRANITEAAVTSANGALSEFRLGMEDSDNHNAACLFDNFKVFGYRLSAGDVARLFQERRQ